MRGYEFHPEAEVDLDAIWEYIAQDSLEAADRFTTQSRRPLKRLSRFLNSGDRRLDLSVRPLRFTNAGN
jgi:plasmid stabilization system protein ParE